MRAGGERRLRPALRRARADVARHGADRLRRRRAPRADRTTRDVLVGGRRVPLVGTVSMDNVTVDLGPEPPAARRATSCCSAVRATSACWPRSGRAGSGRSTTRSPAGSGRACRARTTATARRSRERIASSTRSAALLAGQRRWLVGGAVRDRLLGRDTVDLDVVAAGDPSAAARTLARARRGGAAFRALGRLRRLARRRAGPRVARRPRPRCATTTSTPTSPRATSPINAMAEPLDGGELLDPPRRAGRPRGAPPAHGRPRPLRRRPAAHAARRPRFAVELELVDRAGAPPRRRPRARRELDAGRARARVRRAQAGRRRAGGPRAASS